MSRSKNQKRFDVVALNVFRLAVPSSKPWASLPTSLIQSFFTSMTTIYPFLTFANRALARLEAAARIAGVHTRPCFLGPDAVFCSDIGLLFSIFFPLAHPSDNAAIA
jgi:hypothetical protein